MTGLNGWYAESDGDENRKTYYVVNDSGQFGMDERFDCQSMRAAKELALFLNGQNPDGSPIAWGGDFANLIANGIERVWRNLNIEGWDHGEAAAIIRSMYRVAQQCTTMQKIKD